jgi:hypothetical protein
MITGTIVIAIMLICIAAQAHQTDKQATKHKVIGRVMEWYTPIGEW